MLSPVALDRPLGFRFSIPAHPLSLLMVRRSVQGLAEVCGKEATDVLAIIFSELVTNAIRHSGIGAPDEIEVCLEIDRSHIRGTVVDHGKGFKYDQIRPTKHQEGGFGLHIVGELASRWGMEGGKGTEIWFEL